MHERTRTQCMLHADAATHRTMHTGRCITQAPSLRWLVAFCPCLYLWTMAHRSVCGMWHDLLDMLALKHAHVRAYEHTTHARIRHTKHKHKAHTQSTHTQGTHTQGTHTKPTNKTHKQTHTHTHAKHTQSTTHTHKAQSTHPKHKAHTKHKA